MVRSVHPLFAEVLRSGIPPTRARRLAAELCAQLPSEAGAGAGFLRHAILVLEHDAPADPAPLAAAARLTRLAGDYELAWRLADRVLAEVDPAGEHHAAGALAALTKAAMAADPKAAGGHGGERGIAEAFAEAERWAITEEQQWAVLSERAWSTLIYRGIADARAILDDERGLRRTRRGRLLHDGLTAMFLGFDGQLVEGAARGAAVLAELTDDDPVEAELTARATHAMTAALAGPSRTALVSARRFFELEPHVSSIALNQLLAAVSGELYALAELEGWAAAARHGRRRIDGAVRGSTPWERLGFVHRTMGILATTMGVLTPETRADIDTSIRLLGAADEQRTLSIAVANRASFAAQCADLDAAEAALGRYDDEHRHHEIRSTALADRAHAWLAHQRGDEDAALDWAEEAWLAARVRNQCNAWAAPALHDVVRFGHPERVVDRLGDVSQALGGPFSAALADHARALADGNAVEVEGAAAALGRCGASGLQAEALIHAAALYGGERGRALCESARTLLQGSLLRSPLVVALTAEPHRSGSRLESAVSGPPRGVAADTPIRIERSAGGWLVSHGQRDVAMRDLVGLRHLAVLLRRPGSDVDVAELARSEPLARPGAQAVLDRAAVTAYRRRALELVEELRRARRREDHALIARLEAEAAAVESELRASTALGGATRSFTDDGERARTAVRKAIVRAIDELEVVHPDAARHLRAAVSTGHHCRYDPRL